MTLTDHTDYGLRTLMMLATAGEARLSAAEVAAHHGLSYTHVQKVVRSLHAAGFVTTFRGRGGGVRLARPAAEIRVGEVVRALEPHFELAECFRAERPSCRLHPACHLAHALDRGKEALLAELDRYTLADVAGGGLGAARATLPPP